MRAYRDFVGFRAIHQGGDIMEGKKQSRRRRWTSESEQVFILINTFHTLSFYPSVACDISWWAHLYSSNGRIGSTNGRG